MSTTKQTRLCIYLLRDHCIRAEIREDGVVTRYQRKHKADSIKSESVQSLISKLLEDNYREKDVDELGLLLSASLFHKEFRAYCQKIAQKDNTLRVELYLDQGADAWLADLPWELMRLAENPQKNSYALSAQPNASFVRLVASKRPAPSSYLISRMQLLKTAIIACEPVDSETVKHKEIFDSLFALEEKYPKRLKVIELANGSTLNNIEQFLLEHKPHAIHFTGHSRLFEGEGMFAFVDDNGHPEWVHSDNLGRSLQISLPKLVFFHIAPNSNLDAFRSATSLATQMVRQHALRVITTQYELKPHSTGLFVHEFYKQVIESGITVEAAVQRGRLALHVAEHANPENFQPRDFGAPVLFAGYKETRPNRHSESHSLISEEPSLAPIPSAETASTKPEPVGTLLPKDDLLLEEIVSLQKQLNIHKRNLLKVEEKIAEFIDQRNVSPDLENTRDNLTNRIKAIEQKLAQLKGGSNGDI